MRSMVSTFLLLAASPALAEGWAFTVSPYLWVSGVDSTIPTRLGEVSTSASFGDIIDNLDFAAMALVEARKGRIGLLVDTIHLAVSTEGDLPPGLPFQSAEARIKSWIVTGYGAWRGLETPTVAIDLLLGFRLMSIRSALDLGGGPDPDQSFRRGDSWADPVIGTAIRWQFADKWYARGTGDVGGFGLASDLTFQGLVAVGYAFSNRISAELAYRHLEVVRPTELGDFRQAVKGPLLGVRIGF